MKHHEEMLPLLLELCAHSNSEVRVKSGWAFEAFMTQICSGLNDGQDSSKILFLTLLQMFASKLETNRTLNDITLSVRAFGQLAGPIAVYMGQKELVKAFQCLLRTSERMFSSDNNEAVEKAMNSFPSYVLAYATIIYHLDVELIDVFMMKHLSLLMGPLFRMYPYMVEKRRRRNLDVLVCLFVVLNDKGTIFRQFADEMVWSGLKLSISKLPRPETGRDTYYNFVFCTPCCPVQKMIGTIVPTLMFQSHNTFDAKLKD